MRSCTWASSVWSYLPSGFACQISRSASSTGARSPSSTCPSITIFSPGGALAVRSLHSGWSSAKWKKGPMVCDGVPACIDISQPQRSRGTPAQHDVEAVAEGVLRLAQIRILVGDEPLARRRVGHAVEDGVVRQERIPREVHLGDESRREGGTEERKVDVRRSPGVVRVLPGIGARLDGE